MKPETAQFELSVGVGSQLPACDLPEIVFSGRSNVGKSSLINRLLQRKALARTSNKPGKTATINFYRTDTLRLVDLPGYGYAKVSGQEKQRWGELMQAYFDARRPVSLVVQLVDIRHELSAEDREMLAYLSQRRLPFFVVLTKADKLNKTERECRIGQLSREIEDFSSVKLYPFSALTGEGTEDIRKQIVQRGEQKGTEV